MSPPERLVTSAELAQLRDDDARFELVEGRLIRMSPVGFERGRIVAQLCALLYRHVQAHGGGAIVTDVGFKLKSNPDTVRAPDVAFIRDDRIPARGTRGFVNGRPDVAFEVLSSDDAQGDVRRKIDDYLTRGVPVVVVVNPEERSITPFRQAAAGDALRDEEIFDLSDVIAEFRCRVRDVFA